MVNADSTKRVCDFDSYAPSHSNRRISADGEFIPSCIRAGQENQTAQPAGVSHSSAKPETSENDFVVGPLEDAIEAERSRLMLADSVLGCLQIALDPEANPVSPNPHLPDVVGLARKLVNETINSLEFEEMQRHLGRSPGVDCAAPGHSGRA